MKLVCSSCHDKLSILSLARRDDGRIECGGCEIRRMAPGLSLNTVRLVALDDPPPIRSVFYWLQETAERN
jgi:hypothetical protein